MRVQLYFQDGPCRAKPRTVTIDQHPPQTVTCGGATYVLVGTLGVVVDGVNTGPFLYVVSGGQYDHSAEHIRGERDVFRAYSSLQRALRQTSRAQVNRVQRARRRIKRAVR